ncbi:unnamed protein product [Ambrosiozyma monospora]|uniref:Unnamed protein product n=1 Tax=Ambrosiozyma monospora TaxID=43982 RepID=A0A9W7DK74_AMBMO|nr:unnamed protein product [Ambrosiozyma monospora]
MIQEEAPLKQEKEEVIVESDPSSEPVEETVNGTQSEVQHVIEETPAVEGEEAVVAEEDVSGETHATYKETSEPTEGESSIEGTEEPAIEETEEPAVEQTKEDIPVPVEEVKKEDTQKPLAKDEL